MRRFVLALLLGCATPALAQPTAKPVAEALIDPQRLALAKITIDGVWPAGTYSRMMTQMMGGTMEEMMTSFMNMSEADLAANLGVEDKGKNKKPASKETLREQMRKEDPHFEERMKIMTRVMGEEMGRIGSIMEPKLREGLTKAVAKRFTPVQLAEVNRFLATDAGRTFGGEMMMLWVDPEVFRSMISSVPEMMKEMPAMMQRMEAATAHLPKPKKKEADKEKKAGESQDEAAE